MAELSAKLEGKGVFADQAAEVLESFMFRIKAFEDLALENFNEWSDEERRERAGFLLLALTTLPRAEEASCLAATDSYERFTILDNFLGKTESELSAKVALDGVFGDSAPRAPLPRTGDRISFFWTEEDGWWEEGATRLEVWKRDGERRGRRLVGRAKVVAEWRVRRWARRRRRRRW